MNITIPDQLLVHARAADLNISRLTAAALSDELNRRSKRAQFRAYLDELEAEVGPVSPEEAAEAREWADRVLRPRNTPDDTARKSA